LSHSKTDAEEFAKLLLELTENDEKREQFGKVGWEHVRNKFHFTRLVSDMSELYSSLLNT
jgi:glycosyltransferase involved in cell wall biosynthesis